MSDFAHADRFERAQCPPYKSHRIERAEHVFHDIVGMFEPDRYAHQPVADAEFGALRRGQPLVRGRRRMGDEALGVAEIVADANEIERVLKAECAALAAFDIEGGKKAAFRFQDTLKLIRISNNLGDAKSLITHPATTTHQRLTPAQRAELGITDGLVRVSVGLEHPDDIIEDVLNALEAV